MTPPHPNPCIVVPGLGLCRGGRVFSKLKQAQVRMLVYGKPTAEACVTSCRRSFRPPVLYFTKMFALTTGPSQLKQKKKKLSSLFLQFLRALKICFPVLAPHPVKRVGERLFLVGIHYGKRSWHVQVDSSKRSQTPSQCFWVSDFRPTLPLSPSPSLCLSICRPGTVSSGHSVSAASHYPLAGSGQMESSCMTNVIRRIMHYTA